MTDDFWMSRWILKGNSGIGCELPLDNRISMRLMSTSIPLKTSNTMMTLFQKQSIESRIGEFRI